MFFKKKRRYFLGRVIVTPIGNRKESMLGYGDEEAKKVFENLLHSELGINKLKKDHIYADGDVGIDIIVSDYNYGFAGSVVGDFGFFIFLRPKVKLVARTFNMCTKDTIQEFALVQRMSWRKYIKRLLSIRRTLSFKPAFDSSDLNVVLVGACISLLKQIKASNS